MPNHLIVSVLVTKIQLCSHYFLDHLRMLVHIMFYIGLTYDRKLDTSFSLAEMTLVFYLGAALELLRNQGFTNDRALAPNIAVVITDGLSADPVATKQQVSYFYRFILTCGGYSGPGV